MIRERLTKYINGLLQQPVRVQINCVINQLHVAGSRRLTAGYQRCLILHCHSAQCHTFVPV